MVVVDGESSESAPVSSGVPQGSVRGPILFLVYINDMPECVGAQTRLFADDSIIYRSVKTEEDCQKLQQDLEALHEWETTWGMSFNPSKCNIIHITKKLSPIKVTYTLKGEELEAVDSATYLGIDISDDLTWHNQITKAASKGNRALGFIKRNINSSSKVTKERAYKTIVRPVLEYASTVWHPSEQFLSHNLEKVQRRAARYVCHNYNPSASVTSMLNHLQWETLEQRRFKARVIMLYKVTHALVAIPSVQFVPVKVATRGHQHKFIQIRARTNYYKFTFFPYVIPLWNQLPTDVATAPSLEQFKKGLAAIQLRAPRI